MTSNGREAQRVHDARSPHPPASRSRSARPASVGGRRPPTVAMLLAAGLGTRLRPLTERIPKCMVIVAGKPLLEHAIERLRRHGVEDVVINLHHEPEVVVRHIGDGSRWGVRIRYQLEPSLLGTAGGVAEAMGSATGPFFVWYADNISTCRLDRAWDAHVQNGALVTVALTLGAEPTRGGIAALGADDRIVRFVEKPRPHEVFSELVSAGIMVVEPEAVGLIPAVRPCDFGHDVLPLLAARGDRLYGYRMGPDEVLLCSDRVADLERTRRIAPAVGAGVADRVA